MWVALGLVGALLGAPEAKVEPVAEVAELGWMAGCWRHEQSGRVSEECWMAPRAGLMLGANRDVRGARTFFEFLRIGLHDDRVAYLASPAGRSPTPFFLVERGERRAVFENPEHDFPQRILYWIGDDDRLHARIEGVEDGETRGTEWSWARAPGFE